MRYDIDSEDGYSTRTLAFLTVAYVVAAGCNGVLAVRYRAPWHGMLAVVLAMAASGFLVYTVRTAQRERAARRQRVPPLCPGDSPSATRIADPSQVLRKKIDRASL